MTYSAPAVQDYERRAEELEHSPWPVFLKIGRAVVWVIYAIVLVSAILLTLEFLLLLFGANPDSGFVEWVSRSTERAMRPFRGIFPPRQLDGSSVVDFSYLFAAIVYFVLALLIDAVVRWLTQRLRRQEWETSQARAQADLAAQTYATQRHAADEAAHQAASREYAAQQAAAQQYAIARAAAQEVVAQQNPPAPPSQPVRAKPAPPPAPPPASEPAEPPSDI